MGGLKGRDMNALMDEFTQEMTVVAEGLSEDLALAQRDLAQLSAAQTIMEEDRAKDRRELSDRLEAIEKRLTALEKQREKGQKRGGLSQVWRHADLLRLNLGVFVLHTVQLAMWVAVPALLVQAGLAKAAHWQVYLPAVVLSLVAMGGLFSMERKGKLRSALLGAFGLVLVVQIGLGMLAASGTIPTIWCMALLMFLFFCGFNALEATQPSLVSRMAPAPLRGAALGAYNTLQSAKHRRLRLLQ